MVVHACTNPMKRLSCDTGITGDVQWRAWMVAGFVHDNSLIGNGEVANPKTSLAAITLHDITILAHVISFHPLPLGCFQLCACMRRAVVLKEAKTCVCIVNILHRWHMIIIYNPFEYGYGSKAQLPSLWRACCEVCPSAWKPACCRYFPSLASGSQNLPGRKKRSAWTSSCLTLSQMASVEKIRGWLEVNEVRGTKLESCKALTSDITFAMLLLSDDVLNARLSLDMNFCL